MKNIMYLIIIIILAATALYLTNKPSKTTADLDSGMFRIADSLIAEIHLSDHKKDLILKRTDNNWVVNNKDKRPADEKHVKVLLSFLSDFSVYNVISENPEKLENYRVGTDGTNILVKLTDGSEVRFIAGKDNRSMSNTFYRQFNSDKILTGTPFPRRDLPDDLEGWVKKESGQKNISPPDP
ncbi:MAG: DUF4340 domain-containing protein [Candidatus Delongbacteria bacterium]